MSRVQPCLSLPQLHRALVNEFGSSAPSLSTLKRASAKGALNSAKTTTGDGSRPKFRYVQACAVLMNREVSSIPEKTNTEPRAQPDVDLDSLASRVVDEVIERLHERYPLLRDSARLLAAAETLEVTRKTLMTKYDAVHALQSTMNHTRPSQDSSLQLDLHRMQVRMSRMEELLQNLVQRVQS